MGRNVNAVLILIGVIVFASISLMGPKGILGAGEEETLVGMVVKTDKGIIIEADDGDYLVKGQDLSKMVGRLIEVTGVIKESSKGDIIEVKSYEEVQE